MKHKQAIGDEMSAAVKRGAGVGGGTKIMGQWTIV